MTIITHGTVNAHIAGITEFTANAIDTQFAFLTVHCIIIYKAGIAILAGCTILFVAFQTGIITVVTAHVATVKTTEANHAVGVSIETFATFSAMSMVFYGTIMAHFASITPIAAFAAGLIAHRTTRCVAQT